MVNKYRQFNKKKKYRQGQVEIMVVDYKSMSSTPVENLILFVCDLRKSVRTLWSVGSLCEFQRNKIPTLEVQFGSI